VILTVHHYSSFYWGNIDHLAEAALPVFNALSQLHDHDLISEMPIKGVLLHQASSNSSQFRNTDWFMNVVKLLGEDPNNTQVFLKDDLVSAGPRPGKNGTIINPICVQRAVILDRKHGGDKGHMERRFFSTPHSAFKIKRNAFIAFGLEQTMLHRPPGRMASMIIRSDKQGISNQDEVNMHLKQYLTDRCWSLRLVPPFKTPMHLKDQVALFASTDLSISVHGAHLTNLIWQPTGSGVLIMEKCGFHDKDFSQLANESGIAVYRSRQTSCMRLFSKPKLSQGKHIHELSQPFSPIFDTDLKPALDEALKDMESTHYRGPRCV